MADVFSQSQRSEIMRAVKSRGNKSTELKLIEHFKKSKVTGWRRNYKLFGKPDFVFPKERLAIFVDGCFWHGHDCRNTKPANNAEYWRKKVERNKRRDELVSKTLTEKGWRVTRLWECQIKKNTSQTNWAKVEAMTDADIDTSDIAPLDEKFFANARLRMPEGKVAVTVSVDKDVSDWYHSHGEESKALMSAALKIYAEAHRDLRR